MKKSSSKLPIKRSDADLENFYNEQLAFSKITPDHAELMKKEIADFLLPQDTSESRKSWRVLIFSTARKHNRNLSNTWPQWNGFFQSEPFPQSATLSMTNLFGWMIPLELQRHSSAPRSGWTYILRPTDTDLEFLVNWLASTWIEESVVKLLEMWWPQQSMFILHEEWKPTGADWKQLAKQGSITPGEMAEWITEASMAFATQDGPLTFWDTPVDLKQPNNGPLRPIYKPHSESAMMISAKKLANLPKRSNEGKVLVARNDGKLENLIKYRKIWEQFSDVHEFIMKAWFNYMVDLPGKLDNILKLRMDLMQLKDAESEVCWKLKVRKDNAFDLATCEWEWYSLCNLDDMFEMLQAIFIQLQLGPDGPNKALQQSLRGTLLEIEDIVKNQKDVVSQSEPFLGKRTKLEQLDTILQKLVNVNLDPFFTEERWNNSRLQLPEMYDSDIRNHIRYRQNVFRMTTDVEEGRVPISKLIKRRIKQLTPFTVPTNRLASASSLASSLQPMAMTEDANNQFQPQTSTIQEISPAATSISLDGKEDITSTRMFRELAFMDKTNTDLIEEALKKISSWRRSGEQIQTGGNDGMLAFLLESAPLQWMSMNVSSLRSQSTPSVSFFQPSLKLLKWAAERCWTR